MPGGAKYSNYPDTIGPSPFGTDGAKGVANKSLLSKIFPTPKGMNKDEVAATANAELLPDVLPKNPDPMIYSDADISLGFGTAPDITKGPFSGQDTAAGGTSSPYFPNLASPDPTGSGKIDPVEPTPVDEAAVNGHATRGAGGLVDPSVLSQEMSNSTKISGKALPLGKHPGSK